VRHATFRGLAGPGAVGWAAAAFVAAAVASGLAAFAAAGWSDPDRLKGTVEIAGFALALAAAAAGGYDARFRRLALWVGVASAAAAAAWTGWMFWGTGRSPTSVLSLGNVNTGALYLAFAATASTALLTDAVRRRAVLAGLAAAAALALFLVILVDLGSRTGLLAALAGGGAIGVVALRRYWPFALGGALALLAALIWLRSPELVAKLGRLTAGGLDGAMGVRADIWRLGAAAFAENPLIGVGWRNFRHLDAAALGFDFPPGSDAAMADHAHNQYLTLLAEGGLIGFAAFALLIGALARRLWAMRPRPVATAPVWLTGVGVLAAMLAGGLFELVLVAELALLLAIFAGLAAAGPPPDRHAIVPRFGRAR
jgi:O-antigen ligase